MSAWFRRPWHRSEICLPARSSAAPVEGRIAARSFKGIKRRALEPAFVLPTANQFAITAQLELLATYAGVLELAEQAIEAIFRQFDQLKLSRT